MKIQRVWLPIVFALVTISVAGCHSSEPVSSTATVPPPPPSVQQNAIQAQEYQISHSNLPPDQKQRLLQQLSASGGK